MNKIVNYIKESIAEIKKVSWPTKQETKKYTLMIIGISIGLALIIMILDKSFGLGLNFIINK
jgi:preprotein translocase subunit SecE